MVSGTQPVDVLVILLNAHSLFQSRGPILPKTPSVIFSQGSEIQERHSSICSGSSEEISSNNDADYKIDDTASDDRHF